MAESQAAEPLYVVTGQVEDYDRGPTGSFVQGVRVSFRTRAGAQGSVFVPNGDYTVAKARELIQAKAEAMDAVQTTNQGG